jgi:cell division septation protein DedD
MASAVDSAKSTAPATIQETPSPATGTFYEVQIGAFRNFDISRYNGNLNQVKQEKADGLNKITLGQFSSPEDAKAFQADLRKLGVRRSFIVKKTDGVRQPYDNQ